MSQFAFMRGMGPAPAFSLLSILFGLLLIVVTPPLRGPDESQHFLRVYGIAQGDFVPSSLDERGRKGLFLPAEIHADFAFFEPLPSYSKDVGMRELIELFRQHRDALVGKPASAMVFVPYAGAEGYSPIAYLPYSAGALIGRLFDLGFVSTTYLMRLAGLLAFTAIGYWAIGLVPGLGWAFLAIAMLPAAVYARAVITADAAALVSAMMVTALCLRAARDLESGTGQRAMWLGLCVLTKAPQLTFILLEAMVRPGRMFLSKWQSTVLVIVPSLALAITWTLVSSADVAAWRLVELTGVSPEQFTARWKLGFVLDHPLHFPRLVAGTLSNAPELWRQLIGVLGLFDTPLRSWVYPLISILLILACISRIEMPDQARFRVAFVGAFTTVIYGLGIFVIFYIIWTPVYAGQVWGIQGRYFLPVLPLVALVIGALVSRGLPPNWIVVFSLGTAVVSGIAAIESILRVDWKSVNIWPQV